MFADSGVGRADGRRDKRQPLDRLHVGERLAEVIGESSFCGVEIFIDGFTDFTAEELAVLDELIRADADIEICLNTPDINESDGIFLLPSKTARRLISAAADRGKKSEIVRVKNETGGRKASLDKLEECLFSFAKTEEGRCLDTAHIGDAAAVVVIVSFIRHCR